MMEYKSLGPTPVNDVIKGNPHGWIQFKGTDLCMDVYCKCGEHTHIDGDFLYFIKCGNCGTIYELNGHIELIERENSEVENDIDIIQTTE